MGEVIRCILTTPAAFLAFWKERGPFSYVLEQGAEGDTYMQADEWMFSNDLYALMKAYLGWDERHIRMARDKPPEEDKAAGVSPSWIAENFPEDHEYPFWFHAPQEATAEEAERIFLTELALGFDGAGGHLRSKTSVCPAAGSCSSAISRSGGKGWTLRRLTRRTWHGPRSRTPRRGKAHRSGSARYAAAHASGKPAAPAPNGNGKPITAIRRIGAG
jgi:hypothetical protein